MSAATEVSHASSNRKSAIVNRKSERGVALVITLILLSVTLFMAVAFLAISRRERGSVTTATDTATARLAADSALANAQAQIIAGIFATTNPYNSSLLVSTNFINVNGFTNGVANPLNVNYDFVTGTGLPLNSGQFEQNVANLFLSPRPPVFITTNQQTGQTEFRFYLDLNRNGNFEDSGSVSNVDSNNNFLGPISEVGDPQWIGVLERPDAPHGPNNKFLSRYAFVALPAGNSLDLNAIHNQVYNQSLGTADGYFRNQGVGSWEINLAAFLADLNTNQWDPPTGNSYQYNPPPVVGGNSGYAFEDARALLAYRYNDTYNSLAFPSAIFPNNAAALANEPIDIYPFGLAMTNTTAPIYANPPNLSWAGADNTNHYFDLSSDLFDTTKIAPTNFIFHLQQAGNGVSTYDRYTFYRLLAQLGTDSTPESGKMNLNYDNLTPNANGVASATNLFQWTPIGFFTNAADRMLRLYTTNWFAADYDNFTNTFGTNATPFGVANIPVWVGGRFVYSSAVNRLLQLAANMYDATTNRYYDNSSPLTPLPTVFQPIFSVQNNNVYITNFVEVVNTSFLNPPIQLLNLNFGPGVLATLALQPNDLVFGVPLIIGAKKGFPNFNEFAMQSGFQLTRKLQVTRTSTNAPANTYKINQMFNISATNQLGVECWNSYASNYTRPVNIFVTNYLTMALTNDEGFGTNAAMILSGSIQIPNSTNSVWPAYNPNSPSFSFQIPLNTNVAFVPTSMYRFNGGSPFLTTDLALPFESNVVVNVNGVNTSYPQPNWGLSVTNNLQVIMVDVNSGRIIDYVQLSGPNGSRNLSSEITNEWDEAPYNTGFDDLWDVGLNRQGIPNGIANQISISLGLDGFSTNANVFPDTTINEDGVDGFRAFYHLGQLYSNPAEAQIIAKENSTNAAAAPFEPTVTTYQHITWQANDPLVHYLASDLTTPANNATDVNYNWPGNIGLLNARYLPWGGNTLLPNADAANKYNMALKDPQAVPAGVPATSDNWDFPTSKFPTVGWLGRVHRGTPWQTVYLKSSPTDTNTWVPWTGDTQLSFGQYFDAVNSMPVNDRLLFDIFTTALNDNATRGQLSVNQDHLAAWSAVFSGIVVPTNSVGGYTVIAPAGPAGVIGDVNSQLGPLVTNINFVRGTFTNADGVVGTYQHVGDILRTPQLTEQSPFLTPFFNSPLTNTFNDEMYEWLPQQVMSLLTVSSTPRYVIYSYGQTLKPAPNGISTDSGQFFGMVTNYQVVSEVATRAVVRVNTVVVNTGGTLTTNYSTTVEQFNVLPPD